MVDPQKVLMDLEMIKIRHPLHTMADIYKEEIVV